ncbi:hypothetical protein FNO01nite_22760 [Flavobacterium noncentrifugens]|uniref:histidine kinase n=1 Tax=Flavobacterium noncentrifugens TaxID=1128970 RepID=A0A1G9AVU7_9FLAO|nr:ATP-binding protein [Flavobacterium noncentrifugens]GEP51604.1 hypothetical protein FNO01nite_22760 [Flavobacterium noncentrifugens]SDK31446.1 His Kinase A (phospho-acceptor) domain-containing protein [Flavobacterium noncentrifugens]
MENNNPHIKALQAEIDELKNQLFESNSIIEAIREGAVDALVLNKNGQPHVYSLESADYTYRILIEKFGEGALSISDDGLVLYCNDYFSKLLKIPANKITGSFFQDYMDSEREFQMLKSALAYGPSKGEITLNAGDKKVPVYVSLTDLHPNVNAIGVVVTDLSEKRKHEEALVAYQRQLETKVTELHQTNTNLEQFIHVISHDLKEPIRKIVTYTSHLNETKSELFEKGELHNLKIVNSSALRLNSLVDDLVKYAFSAVKTEEMEVDLNKILKEVLDDLELNINDYSATIKFSELPVIAASKVQMRQLFSNLISNAIKYSKRGIPPEISITASVSEFVDANNPQKKFHHIRLQDNGIGMDKMYLTKIFTIFQRLHMRNEYSGNGIGLAICKKIMENHLGKINVESTPGEGSVFNLYFPINA